MHVLCFGIDVTATKLYRKLLFLKKKNSSKHKPLFKIIGRISGDNAESPN